MNLFKQFNSSILKPLNMMWEKVTRLDNLRGDGFINVKKSGAGTTIGLNLNEVRRRVSRVNQDSVGDPGTLIRATCTEDAPSDNTITANLFLPDGTEGDAIVVHCNISNGTALDDATPRLKEDDEIFVTESFFDDTGTPTERWYCVSNFDAGKKVRRAICNEDAPAGDEILANLFDSDGNEIIVGDESGITVVCQISGGSDLSEATRRLEEGSIIFVIHQKVDSVLTWLAVEGFQATEDCTCEQPDAVFNSVTIAADEKMTYDGVGGDSYDIYNTASGEMERWVDGVKITSWKA